MALPSRPDRLIVIGVLKPRGASLKLHRELRAEAATRDIPLLVVDDRATKHLRKGWKTGEGLDVDGCLTQPVEPEELREEVARVLGHIAPRSVGTIEVLSRVERLLQRMERILRCSS